MLPIFSIGGSVNKII
jgi:hypothetical protein